MSKIVSMHVAKSTLSQLVKRVAGGETIYIGAYGNAEAKLVPVVAGERPQKRFGILKGKLQLPDDLDAPLPEEVLKSFEGEV
jgi:antitoxin (DNA-binding transcriptional repressor) of toxin-antitoxin stability system